MLRNASSWLPSAVTAALCAAFLLYHAGVPWMERGEPTAYLLPCLAVIVIFFACMADLTGYIFRPLSAEQNPRIRPIESPARLAWYLGALLAFAVLIQPLGLIVTIAIVFPLLLRYAEHLIFLKSIVITIISGLVIHLVFERALDVNLPKGNLFALFFQ